jgi:spore coat protein U-like protein
MTGLGALLWACSQALGAAAWVGQPFQLTMPTHITAAGQSFIGSINLTLDHDAPCTLAVSVASSGDQVLKRGAAELTTFYKISGPQVSNSDGDWVGADEFLTHIYTVMGSGAADTITLSVKGTAPALSAPDAGDYSASLILTVSW